MSVWGQIRGQEWGRQPDFQPVSIDIATILKIHFRPHLITLCAAASLSPTFPGLPQTHRGSWSLLPLAVVCGSHSSSSAGRSTLYASAGPSTHLCWPASTHLTPDLPHTCCCLHSPLCFCGRTAAPLTLSAQSANPPPESLPAVFLLVLLRFHSKAASRKGLPGTFI